MREGDGAVIEARRRDVAGLPVRRVLPAARRRMVGPFIFLDEMGPVTLAPGAGIDVPAHPHIGLATVTYLFDGSLRHRDSLGSDQMIGPGDVNWMVAGRGITHSERSDDAARADHETVWGLQTWVALPDNAEDRAPLFEHFDAGSLPEITGNGVVLRLILGEAYGETAPARVFSPLFYMAGELEAGARLPLETDYKERALYVADGQVSVGRDDHDAGRLVVLAPGTAPAVTAVTDSRVMLLGGAPVGPRLIWWNFVASTQDRLDTAKAAWRAGDFALPPGDDAETVPAPAD